MKATRLLLYLASALSCLGQQGWTDLGANTIFYTYCPANGYNFSNGPGCNGLPGCTSGSSLPAVQNGVTQVNVSYKDLCYNIINNSGGAAVDTKRNRLVIFGGGHAGTPENSVYVLDPVAKTYTRLTNPSVVDLSNLSIEVNPSDGTPVSRHTYACMIYLPVQDKLFQFDGPTYGNGVSAHTHMWLFNFATNTWADPAPTFTMGSTTGGTQCVYDPNQQLIYIQDGNNRQFFTYNPASNVVTQLTSSFTFCNSCANANASNALSPVLDPEFKRIYWIGTASQSTPNGSAFIFWYTDINPASATYMTTFDITTQTSGCGGTNTYPAYSAATKLNVDWPGLVYDTSINKVVGYPWDGTQVIIFDPVTYVCTAQTQAVFNNLTIPPSKNSGESGSFGRFNYFPAINKYVLVNGGGPVAASCTGAGGINCNHAYSFTLHVTPTIGQGQSTYDLKDRDGDGYGVGILRLGPGNDLVINGSDSTKVTSAGFPFTSGYKGQYLNITGGVGFTVGTYQITDVTAGVATLSASAGTVSSTSGSWVIPGALGVDADDLDATAHTASDVITRYGSLDDFFHYQGYTPNKYWFLSPTGNDGTGASNTPAQCGVGGSGCAANPYLTWTAIHTLVAPGNAVILRDQWGSSGRIDAIAGTAGNPIYYMSYPGEQANFCCGSSAGIYSTSKNWIVIRGVKCSGASCGFGMGTDEASFATTQSNNKIVSEVEGISGDGQGLAPVSGFNGLVNEVIEDSVLHDNPNQHCIYIGARTIPNVNVVVRRNICYNDALNNYHFNGRFNNLQVFSNAGFNSQIAGFSSQMGVHDSIFRSNIIWQQDSEAVDLDDYGGSTTPQANNCGGAPGGGAPNGQPCLCPLTTIYTGTQNVASICPYDQNHNIFENNTWYQTGKTKCALSTCTSSGTKPNMETMVTFNTSDYPTADLGHNVWRNNIVVNFGNNNVAPQFHWSDTNGTSGCGTTCQGWVNTSVLQNNLFFHNDGNAGNNVINVGNTKYTLASFATAFPSTVLTNNLVGDPKLTTAAATTLSPLFNLNLLNNSPAIGTGFNGSGDATNAAEPVYDQAGNAFSATTPAIGGLETLNAVCRITTSSLPDAHIGTGYSQTLAAPSPCVAPVTWSVIAGSIPAWAALNSTTGVVSGTPGGGTPVTSSFTVQAADSGGGTPSQALSIYTCTLPVITTTSPLPDGNVSVAYSQTIAATGDATITFVGIGIPAWATLSSGGVLSGTPNIATVYTIGVTATNSCGTSAQANFSLTTQPLVASGSTVQINGQVTIK